MAGKRIQANEPTRRDVLRFGLYFAYAAGISGASWLAGCMRKEINPDRVIVITLDTTRADRLGCYGCSRNTSPNIDEFSKDTIMYTHALATSSWTLPSHASLFTGKMPSCHGAQYDENGPLCLFDAIEGSERRKEMKARGLAKDELTLAEILRRKNYETGAVVAGPWLKKFSGLDMGFTLYDDRKIDTLNGRSAEDVTSAAFEMIEKFKTSKFFLFLNYFDPHRPYQPSEEYEKVFMPEETKEKYKIHFPENKPEHLTPKARVAIKALYDAEILYMDYHVGRLLDRLKNEGFYDNALIILTSDHGELLGE
ncbi:MAG: sulfatase, partial [Planctomycetes bacterium]|nr:sulfatase [Planctomycetota bacterium]